MADGVTKALAVVRRVGKQVPKLMGTLLPVASIGVNALSSWQKSGGDAVAAGQDFMLKYIPINPVSGKFQTNHLMEGLGSLVVSAVAGRVISYLA